MEIDRLAELARRGASPRCPDARAVPATAIDVAPDALPRVAYLLVGGGAVSVGHMRRGVAALPTTRIINGYGPAETTVVATRYAVPATLEADAPSVPIGRDCADKVTYLLDPQQNLVPIGLVGEIYIGGPSVARGYVNNPAATAERFVPDFLSGQPGARMYRTGDLARRRADGVLEFVGRSDDQVKLRGVRIELAEIEAALGARPAVRDAAVVLSGEVGTERSLVAYVVPRDPAGFDPAQVRRDLAERLPAVMVPAQVVALAGPAPHAERQGRSAEPRGAAPATARRRSRGGGGHHHGHRAPARRDLVLAPEPRPGGTIDELLRGGRQLAPCSRMGVRIQRGVRRDPPPRGAAAERDHGRARARDPTRHKAQARGAASGQAQPAAPRQGLARASSSIPAAKKGP